MAGSSGHAFCFYVVYFCIVYVAHLPQSAMGSMQRCMARLRRPNAYYSTWGLHFEHGLEGVGFFPGARGGPRQEKREEEEEEEG